MNFPLLMVIAFLILTLIVGLYFSKKTTTLREYAVGNKQFATATLVATTLASNYAACLLMNNVQQVHQRGLYWVFFMLLTSGIPFWIISRLAVRMGRFMYNLSMTESIGKVYGPFPRIIAACACISSAIASIALQVQVMSMTIGMCVGLESTGSKSFAILSTLVLILYSTFGGIRAVTFTDVLQFITFTIIIPLLVVFMFQIIHIPGADIITFLQNQSNFQLNKVFHFDKNLIAMIALALSALVSYIEPVKMQRVYMSSGIIQAKKVFMYAGFFSLFIDLIMLLIGLFVFLAAPTLQEKEIWPYVMSNIPLFFKGFFFIALLAMDMSTADSDLNSCAVMVSHDIVESLKEIRFPLIRTIASINPLRIARATSCVVGICAMFLAFREGSLLDLLCLMFDFFVPVITAPYVLAIYGFRSGTHTAVIGMTVGAWSIWMWNKFIMPIIDINGSFFCMLANGLAMLAAHYLLPQREGSGWVPPDKEFQQIQQEKERIQRRKHKAILEIITHKKVFLATLQPTQNKLLWIGGYLTLTSFFTLLYYLNNPNFNGYPIAYPIMVLLISLSLILYGIFADLNRFSAWVMGSYWLIALILCLPIHSIYNVWYMSRPLVMLFLTAIDFSILLWALPFWVGISTAAPLLITYVITVYQVAALWPFEMAIVPIFGFSAMAFGLMIFSKYKLTKRKEKNRYFMDQQKQREAYQLKSLAYNRAIASSPYQNERVSDGDILTQAIENVTQSITFFDEHYTFNKEDFQSIVNNFSKWATYLKHKAHSRDINLLQPTTITIEDLIDQIEATYEQEKGHLPRLWIEKVALAGKIPPTLIADQQQLVFILVTALQQVAKTSPVERPMLTLTLHITHLQYLKSEPLDDAKPTYNIIPSIAFVISHSHTKKIPKVESLYSDDSNDTNKLSQEPSENLDIHKSEVGRIVRSHYGRMFLPSPDALLLVIPQHVSKIQEAMLRELPEASLTAASTLTPQEMAASLTTLVNFHDAICAKTDVEPAVIAGILLLLRRCYAFKKHACGQLFYLRAIGIAQLVADWAGFHPKVIYAALLYDLVRYTRLPLSYIKANYNLGVLCFVENVLSMDSHAVLQKSLLTIPNRFKKAIAEEQRSVLYIKLAERLYDLRHAAGYANAALVKTMVKETLTIDVPLAQRYLEPRAAVDLEKAAREAEKCGKEKA